MLAGDAAAGLLLLVAAAVVTLMALIVVTRAVTVASRARLARLRADVLPEILRVTDGEDVAPPSGRRRTRVMGEVAAAMAHKVRGADRDALAAWLRANGYLDRARRGLASRLAVRRARSAQLYLAASGGHDVGPVLTLLRDPHAGVRATAVQTLGQARAVDALPELVRAVGARRGAVTMSSAAMAIFQAGPSSAGELDAAWTAPDPRVRRLAVDAAGALGLADARSRLEQVLADDDALRVHAAVALGRIGAPASLGALHAARARAASGSAEQRAVDTAIGRILLGEDGA